MPRHLFIRYLIGVILVALVMALPAVALAHDHRSIGGKYDATVGWDVEPAYVNQPNGASIRLYLFGTKTPVLGVEKTLKVQIAAGGNDPVEFALHTVNGKPGYYVADYTPTKTGSYIFTFVGKIGALDVHEEFESGPNRFDDVEAIPPNGISTAAATVATTSNPVSDTASAGGITVTAPMNPALIGLAVSGVVTLVAVGFIVVLLFRAPR